MSDHKRLCGVLLLMTTSIALVNAFTLSYMVLRQARLVSDVFEDLTA